MTHFVWYWGWQSAGVGNFTAGAVAGLLGALVIKRWRLHEKARTWLHSPLHERLERLEESHAELHRKLDRNTP